MGILGVCPWVAGLALVCAFVFVCVCPFRVFCSCDCVLSWVGLNLQSLREYGRTGMSIIVINEKICCVMRPEKQKARSLLAPGSSCSSRDL